MPKSSLKDYLMGKTRLRVNGVWGARIIYFQEGGREILRNWGTVPFGEWKKDIYQTLGLRKNKKIDEFFYAAYEEAKLLTEGGEKNA